MATWLYLNSALATTTRGVGDSRLGYASGARWNSLQFGTSIGGNNGTVTCTTVAGNTSGIEVNGASGHPAEWLSEPLASDTTISGTITAVIRCYESSMSANCTPRVIIDRVDSVGTVQETVADSTYTAEVGTSVTLCNWNITPTSTQFYKGDRIRARVAAQNYGTMGGGYTFTLNYDTASANGTYDSSFSFNETLTFLTTASGTTIYPTDTSVSVVSTDDLVVFSDNMGSGITDWEADNWTPYANNYAAIVWSSGEGDPDAGAIQITTNGSGTDQSCMRKNLGIVLDGGVTYTLRFRIKRISGTGTWQWNFGSESKAVDNTDRASNQWNQSITTSWVEKTLTWTPPRTCLDPVIWIAGYGTTTQVAVVDTVSITREYDLVQREAWTSRGSGVTYRVAETVAGWTQPIIFKYTGNILGIEWYTRQLQAFTLGGLVTVNARTRESATGARAGTRCEIAVCNSDGTNPTVWAAANTRLVPGTSESAKTLWLAGDDVSVSDGQRLRIRFYIDDQYDVYDGTTYEMLTAYLGYLYYAGSAGATGDTYLTFSQTLSEYSSGGGTEAFPFTGGGYYP